MEQVENDAIAIGNICVGTGIKKYRFDIPTYQRGYRWEKLHITKLLDDIYNFNEAKKEGKPVGEFYCLQPITLKRRLDLDNEIYESYEVVDGQQRLISLSILLYALKYDIEQGMFSVTFERDRTTNDLLKREDFLKNIAVQKGPKFSKADYFYMFHAYEAAHEWLEAKKKEINRPINDKVRLAITDSTKVIWYEIDIKTSENDGAREMFRHINDGKIALTDSELIKASLLNCKRVQNPVLKPEENAHITKINQTGIANIWDETESTLRNNQFWTFISNQTYDSHTRIDFIFELLYQSDPESRSTRNTDGVIFRFFEKRLENENDADEVWKNARENYRTFCDWFEDIKTYNYIGYILRYADKGILYWIDYYRSHSKTEFLNELKGTFDANPKIVKEDFEGLSYSGDREKIVKLLLRANIESSNNMGRRFNFVTNGGWSVEHVFAQNSKRIKPENRIDWLRNYGLVVERVLRTNIKECDDLQILKTQIDDFVDKQIGDFDNVFSEILAKIEQKVVDIDSIANLALLGKGDNSALSNSAFYEKREKIIKMSESGQNIPPETLNLFMKFHPGETTNLDYWSEADGKAYLKRLEILLGLCKEEQL